MKDLSFVLRGPTEDDPRPVVIAFGLATEKDFRPYKCSTCGSPVSEKAVVLNRAGDPFCGRDCRAIWQAGYA
jgi:hypothetical protein